MMTFLALILNKVVAIINTMSVSAIHIEGGEPFLYPKFKNLIDLIDEREKIYIVTNGYLINDDIVKILLDKGVDKYVVSIDYLDGSTDVTKKSCYQAISVLNKYNIEPEISVILSKNNYLFFDKFGSSFR